MLLVLTFLLAIFGLLAYPALGLYKSMNARGLSPAQARVLLAREVLSSYINGKVALEDAEAASVISMFEARKNVG